MTMQTAFKFIYGLSVSFWIGSIFFFSFFAAPGIFKVLPKETAGNVVSEIFPKYYLVAYICGGAAVLTTIMLRIFYVHKPGIMFGLKLGVLLAMLAPALYAGQVLRPKAVEARAEMRSLSEESPNYPAIHDKFSKLHTRSVIINSAVLLFGIAILFMNAYTNEE